MIVARARSAPQPAKISTGTKEMPLDRETTQTEPVIKCSSVYKIFGENAKKMLREANGNVDAKAFQEAGCVVGVNNASFEVHKGEMLVVMGLSGSGKSTLDRKSVV
jgi:ABC-type glutathione transport system ATPase component